MKRKKKLFFSIDVIYSDLNSQKFRHIYEYRLFFKNKSTEAHVDLGSVHMTVKQPINLVKKKSIDSIKTSNRLFAVMKIKLLFDRTFTL